MRVDGARDGVEALHFISRIPYNALVLDLMMPKMSGIDLLDSLAALSAGATPDALHRTPAVFVITAAAEADIPSERLLGRFGVRRVFRKPLDMETLAAEIEDALRLDGA